MNIFIAGGTTGIGFALALHYLKEGNKVGICGRDLKKVSPNITHKYSSLFLYEADVKNKENLQQAICSFSNMHDGKLDLIIACAGSYANNRKAALTKKQTANMLEVNIVGTCNTFEIARKIMLKKRSGHMVAIASVAGLLNYPGASVYSQTKKVVLNLCQAYHTALIKFGIHVSAIAPGYIDTKKLRKINNNNIKNKPFLIPLSDAVSRITKSINEKKQLTIFPKRMKLTIKFLSFLPHWLLSLILLKGKRTKQ